MENLIRHDSRDNRGHYNFNSNLYQFWLLSWKHKKPSKSTRVEGNGKYKHYKKVCA